MERLEPLARKYGSTDHALWRIGAEQRGIGYFEVLAAIDDPDEVRETGEQVIYIRGDVKVVVKGDTIITVADRMQDKRTKTNPRKPVPLAELAARLRQPRSQALDEAWALSLHNSPAVRFMCITPEFAAKLLVLNTSNRPLKPKAVAEYAAAMRAAEWRGETFDTVTHEGVALDRNLVLQDGQNRLTACVETGKSFWWPVFVGMHPDNYSRVNTGRNRSYADVLAKAEFSNGVALGALAKLVHLYQGDDKVFSTAHTPKVSNAVVLSTVLADSDELARALAVGYKLKAGALCTVTGAGAAYYVIRRLNPPEKAEKVDEFFDRVASGFGINSDADPVQKFRNQMRNRKGKRSYGPEHLALLLKAWRLWAQGLEAKSLSWRRDEKMPTVYVIEEN